MGCVVVSSSGEGAETIERLVSSLAERGIRPAAAPLLYHLPESSPVWDWLRSLPRPVHLVSPLQARAMVALLARHGIADVVCHHVDEDLPAESWSGNGATEAPVIEPPDKRWYPVLEKARCQECRHCLDFCLFGVYELVDGKVVVANPDRCKAGCPACARICAASAIMFPLYQRDPAVCGAPGALMSVSDEARAMYQKRTGKTLELAAAPPTEAPREIADELDRLISDLETFDKGRRP